MTVPQRIRGEGKPYALRDYLNEALASQDGMPLLLYGDFNDGPSDSAVQVIQGPVKTEYRLNRLKPRDSRGGDLDHLL